MTEGPRTFMFVSHTHWDREWYQPFEEFRSRLVKMMDSLLALLDRDPEYRYFVLDGQTVPLDDYLEIRPDRRPDIERLVREGRLLIGPNYMLPDEFLIGGEAWVRNLQFGIRSAEEYGRVMRVGYSPDAFGHIAHLPAILRGFGIDSVAIWRGVGREVKQSEFRWAAPDGSEVLVIHFPYGYGMLPAIPEDRGLLTGVLNNVRNLLEPLATTRFVLVPNGTDHLPAHEGLSEVIRAANEIMPDAKVIHGNYPMFVEAVRGELDGRYDDLQRVEGEFRSPERSNVLAGVLSTRIWLKQRYQQCEDLLARYAEPLAAWTHLLASADGGTGEAERSTRGLLRQAWRLLLQNGPHDSVTGCSVDAVYDDVRSRFDRCEQLGEAVLTEAQRTIAALAAPAGEPSVVVFNPENGPRTDVCTVRLPVESGKLPSALTDESGQSIPLQITGRGGYSPVDRRERVTAAFVPPAVPGYGYRVLRVDYGDAASVGAGFQPARDPLESGNTIENEFYRVEADAADGSLTVTDKRSGVIYAGLNRFVDGGERGDEYTYCPPKDDRFVDLPFAPPAIAVTESGPVRQTLEVLMTYALPAKLTDDRKARSEELAPCEIIGRVRLYPGVARVEIETEVENRAEDHRLRVHFPSGLRTDHSLAEQHFGVVQRPIELPVEDGTWPESPVGTYPQKAFVYLSDGSRGLMIANRGLPEYEALREADGTATIALTLLRCVSWLSRDDMSTRRGHAGPPMYTPGAQMPGRWCFEYAIIPHEGGWQNASAEAHRFLRPLRAIRTTRGRGVLPRTGSLVEISPPQIVLSTLKPAEAGDGVVARVYNIGDEPVSGRLRLNAASGDAERVDLNEDPLGPAEPRDGGIALSLRRNEIVTLKFKGS